MLGPQRDYAVQVAGHLKQVQKGTIATAPQLENEVLIFLMTAAAMRAGIHCSVVRCVLLGVSNRRKRVGLDQRYRFDG